MSLCFASLRSTVLLSLSCALLAACGSQQAPPQMPPSEVGTLEVQPSALSLALEYTAQLRGIREVEVRSRVSGILLKRMYQEGARVKAGELLFRIGQNTIAIFGLAVLFIPLFFIWTLQIGAWVKERARRLMPQRKQHTQAPRICRPLYRRCARSAA